MADQHQAERPHATPSIWTFILADCFGFTIFFIVFMTERLKTPLQFDASARLLDSRLGFINTLILVTSGWLVALAMAAERAHDDRRARRLLIAGLGMGSCFALIKIFEYSRKIADGITPTSDAFFTFYYILTGVHFLHYLGGLVVLAAMIAAMRHGASRASWLESGALYWHMVDLLWLFLFPMLYLLPPHA